MAIRTGEMSVAANGIQIEDAARGETFAYTHGRVEMHPLYLTLPNGTYTPHYFAHDVQLLQPALETVRFYMGYQRLGPHSAGASAEIDGASAGVYETGPSVNHAELGTPVPRPTYDDPAPRYTENLVFLQTQNDVGASQAQALYIEEKTYETEDAAEPPYEVTGTDPTGWTFFEPNRSCSAFLMQRILAGNTNKLTATSMSAQTVAF
jgi:hypothetical protein